MSFLKRFAPFSLLSAFAAAIALAIAWEPRDAEANRPEVGVPELRASIMDSGQTAAPECPHAVWPYVARDCLLFPTAAVAEREVRQIVIDTQEKYLRRRALDGLAVELRPAQ